MANELVLVTGGSGFIGTHCILQLLEAGYRVRTTVRSLKREADVRAMLQAVVLRNLATVSPSSSPTWKTTPAGRRLSPAATMCCTWPRLCRPALPNTRMS